MDDQRAAPAILLVENDYDIAALTREVLEDEGYRVEVVPTHAAALATLATTLSWLPWSSVLRLRPSACAMLWATRYERGP